MAFFWNGRVKTARNVDRRERRGDENHSLVMISVAKSKEMLSLPVECSEKPRLMVSCDRSKLRADDSDRAICTDHAGRMALAAHPAGHSWVLIPVSGHPSRE